jgi:hypothetical protein
MQHIILALFEANHGRVIVDHIMEYRPDGVIKFQATDRSTYLCHANDLILVPGAKLLIRKQDRNITSEEKIN